MSQVISCKSLTPTDMERMYIRGTENFNALTFVVNTFPCVKC